MPLTREQLAILPAPTGWVWHTRPSLRTRGYVQVDDSQGIGRSNAAARMDALRTWAETNDLGVVVVPLGEARMLTPPRQAYSIISHAYYEVPFPRLFKVTANSPEKSRPTFGDYTCSCGRTIISPSNPVCANCGTYKCAQCGAGFVKLFRTIADNVDYFQCGACTKPCEGCSEQRVGRGQTRCHVCDPRKTCFICMTHKESSEVTEVDPTVAGRLRRRIGDADKAYICNYCGVRYFCEKCKTYDFSSKRAPGVQCAQCKAKELDVKRVPLEKLPEDWIPAGGSLLIPSTDFRPFRTISIEMELDGDGVLAAQTLYACGLVPIPTVASYQQHPDTELEYPCFLKHDGSVSAGELIAYLLNLDDKAHADVLMDVCKKVHSLVQLKKLAHGPTAGGHIHADAHNFSYGDVWRLVTGFNYIEDPFYRIAGAGAEYGHRSLRPDGQRLRAGGYAASPVKGPFGTKGALGNSIQAQGRHHGLNFTPYLGAAQVCKCGSMMYDDAKNCKCNLGKATIEFRVFNSTHNPRILHAWIALVQALMAWSTGDGDPTEEWERGYPALPWTNLPWHDTSQQHKDTTAERIEWMFRNLPLTENERDSLIYTIEQTDIDLGASFSDHLRGVIPATDFEVKKPARNPARRQRAIRVGVPTPGSPPVQPRSTRQITEQMVLDEVRRTRQRTQPSQTVQYVTHNAAGGERWFPPQPAARDWADESEDL